MHGGDGWGWWMMWGGVMMVVFWGAIIGLIVWGVQAATRREDRQGGASGRPSAQPPDDIAKERYARGEIGREEFEQITADLRSSGKPRVLH